MVVEIMLRLFHYRKKNQDFGKHEVAELRFEMQTNGTMSKLERGVKNQGIFEHQLLIHFSRRLKFK